MDQSLKPPLVFNVVDYGAVGNGIVDDTAAIQRAAAALQTAGGGTIFFPPKVYNIFQSTTGTLCAFSNLTGVSCLGYGATLQVYTSKVITASEGFFFGFSNCKNILVDGFTTNGPTLDVSSSTVKGYQFVNCQSGCRNLSMPNNRVKNALAGLICEKLLADPDSSRTQNIHIGVLDVVNCWYGICGIYSGDFMKVDCLRTDTIHRSCFIYGASNLDLTIYSKDCVGSSDVPLATKAGVPMTDVRVNYFCTTDTQASLVAPKVKISFSDQTPGLLRNFFINLNIEYNATGSTGGAALFIEKLTNAGAPDTSDRGHKLQNLVVSGTIKGSPSYNDGGIIVTDVLATWGTGDFFSNISLENLRIEASGSPSATILTLGNCVDNILLKNVYSNGAMVIRNAATGDLRLPFVATTVLDNVVCTNRWAYDGTYQPIDNIRATGASETVRAGWSGHSVSNLGAGGTMTWTLPAAVVGLEYMFQRQDAQTMNVDPNGSEIIRGNGAGVAVTLSNAGDFLHLKCYITGVWEILSSQGIAAAPSTPVTVYDNAFTIKDEADPTKTLVFSLGGMATANDLIISAGAQTADRTVSFPVLGGSDTLVALGTTNAFTGSNTFLDSLFAIVGNGDATKRLIFEVDSQTTGKTVTFNTAGQTLDRIINLPVLGGNDTLATLGVANVFTATNGFTGLVSLGTATATSTATINARYDNASNPTIMEFRNGSAGTGVYAGFRATNDSASVIQIICLSSTYTTSGVFVANRGVLSSSAAAGLVICNFTGSAPIIFAAGGTTEQLRLDSSGQLNLATTTESSSTSTGSFITAGGAGITKNLYVGGNTNIAGTLAGYLAGMVVESGTTFTFSQATHGGRVVITTNGSAVTATVPVTLPVGFNCTLIQGGAGQVTVASDGSSVVVGYLSQLKTAAQYAYTVLSVPQTIGTAIFGGTTA